MKIIFILYNIFEVKSGVSNKYIKFINYLIKKNINYLIFTCFNNDFNEYDKYNIIKLKGIEIPFYDSIKIPIINLEKLKDYVDDKDIIIFNSEFYWLYNILFKLKKEKNIKLIPNWHTNYDYYANIYFKSNSLLLKIKNIIYNHLENNFFSGLITTGEISKNNFLQYSLNIFNANEICLENFNIFKINKYNKKNQINFIYNGRIALEKNLTFIIDILNEIEIDKYCIFKNYKMHIIGNGPYSNKLKSYINDKNNSSILKKKILFYGEINYSEVQNIYNKLENRIFIQPSISETFGKSTMEASYSGIPIFIKKCEIHDLLYNENNSFIFENKDEFINQLTLFFQLNQIHIENILQNGRENALKYDQNIIFDNLLNFILNSQFNEDYKYNEKIINYLFKSMNFGFEYFKK